VASLAAAATDPKAFVDRAREAARAATPAAVAQAARDSVNNLAQMVTGDAAAQNVLRLSMIEGGAGVIVNVGTGKGSSVHDVVDSMGRAAGHPIESRVVGRRAGDPSTLRADASHAADVLGWRSRLDLDDMTASAFAGLPWLKEHGYC
jgi:UDP-glucose 4-epimerase